MIASIFAASPQMPGESYGLSGKSTVLQPDIHVLFLDIGLDLIRKGHRLAGAYIDNAVNLALNTRFHDHLREIIHMDEIVEILAGRKRKCRFAVLCRLIQLCKIELPLASSP